MAAANFDACIDAVLIHEGGLSMLRADPGNWTGGRVGRGFLRGTNYGIAASAHPMLDISNLTRDDAKAIYRRNYWNEVGGDALPAGVDLAVLDPAVNSGPRQALKWLAAARVENAAHDLAVIDAICAARLSFLHALGTWRAFGRGWGARVAAIEAQAHRMVLGTGPSASGLIRAKATLHKGKASSAKTTAGVSVSLAVVGAGGSTMAGDLPHVVVVFGLVVALAVAGMLLFIAWRHGQRAAALAAEATTSTARISPNASTRK